MKECGFVPTPHEAELIEECMEYRLLKRSSDYARIAIMQLVRRDIAARNKTRTSGITASR